MRVDVYLIKRQVLLLNIFLTLCVVALPSSAHDQISLPQLIKDIKPSVIGVGIYTPIESRSPTLIGSGFVVGNGKYIVTNYHVVAKVLDPSIVQYYVALSGEGKTPTAHRMTMVDIDPVHDLAILSIDTALPAMQLASDEFVESGTSIVMTGYPIGAVLGLYPATHTGIVAAVAPDANPARNADDLTISMLKRLEKPFLIYQLDITAFPGNSGSAVYNRNTGEAIAVLNKVYVSAGKEAALSSPSGISYAIPIKHLRALANKNDIKL